MPGLMSGDLPWHSATTKPFVQTKEQNYFSYVFK